MFKLMRRLAVLAMIGAAINYVVRRRRDDTWDAEAPEGDWGVEQTNL